MSQLPDLYCTACESKLTFDGSGFYGSCASCGVGPITRQELLQTGKASPQPPTQKKEVA